MKMTVSPTTHPVTKTDPSCHRINPNSRGWLSQRPRLLLAGGAVILALGLALSLHWITPTLLAPLLYVLPCAFMMLMCMRGMGHNQQTDHSQDVANAGKPTGTSADVL